MERLHFTTDIDAPPSRVWAVLWDDTTYRDWTSVFAEGSYAVSDWHQGSPIRFLGPGGSGGMLAMIDEKVPDARMVFRHVAEIKDGQEQPPGPWAGALETYTLSATDRGTTLVVELDTEDDHAQSFREMFPRALERVKALAEHP
jgi:uncharacterized protein YndB with AHSA1/START domain